MKTEKKENPIQKYLDEKGMRPSHLAKLANIAPSMMHAYYYGKSNPRRSNALRICRATNYEIKMADLGFN